MRDAGEGVVVVVMVMMMLMLMLTCMTQRRVIENKKEGKRMCRRCVGVISSSAAAYAPS